MDTLSYKTKSANKETVERKWWIVDAEDQVLGRMCTGISHYLRGKHKPSFTPHVDCGDYIIVINAEKILMTGNKWNDKEYQRYSGYPGGQKSTTAKQMLVKKPEFIIENAVKGMLPKNKLSKQVFKKLFVCVGPDHPHSAQSPEKLEFAK